MRQAFALVLMLLAMLPAHAGVFDSRDQDFRFYFGVNGYEANTWFGEPAALALDQRSGIILVADKKAGCVDAFGLQGTPRFQYGPKNGLKAPIGLAVAGNGDVYVAEDEGGPIKIIGSKGEMTALELPAEQAQESPKPGRMTLDQDGNLYVVERTNCRVYVFDKGKKLKFKLGGIGDKRGEFKMLQDVAVDRQGRIYALDSIGGIPVQVFDRKGNYLYGFGSRGEGEQNISFPAGLFIDREDQIWVVDKTQHSLKVFDRSGVLLRAFGNYGQGEGMLFYPVDAGIDNFGRIYVLEAGSRRLQVFSLNRPFEPFSLSAT